MTDVTQILSEIEQGDPSAAEQLLRWCTTSYATLPPRDLATKIQARYSGVIEVGTVLKSSGLSIVHRGSTLAFADMTR